MANSDIISIADLVLDKMQNNRAMEFGMLLRNIKSEVFTKEEQIPDSMKALLSWEVSGLQISQVRDFLFKQDYIAEANQSSSKDILTEKGKKAKELGGHAAYLEWERLEKIRIAKDKKISKKITLLQLYWWVPLIVGGLLGFFLDIGKELILQKKSPQTTPQQELPQPRVDTFYIYGMDTLRKPQTDTTP